MLSPFLETGRPLNLLTNVISSQKVFKKKRQQKRQQNSEKTAKNEEKLQPKIWEMTVYRGLRGRLEWHF
ncbi:MAG: hypothetical protein NC452_11300 [Eubacterium sp.]|nr:hypothetical protein [Eubacterium sp.]